MTTSPRLLNVQAAARDSLAQQIQQVTQPETVRTLVARALPQYRTNGHAPADWTVDIVQNDGTGAATIVYEFDGSARVFGKLYLDDSGQHAYRVLRTLWSDGFGAGSRYQVAEPLAFDPTHNMLLIRGADGPMVASAPDDDGLAAGSRDAARWLVKLHRSPARVGDTKYPWEVYHKLMHRLTKAAAAHPDRAEDFIDMSDRFEELTNRLQLRFVQSHGQFRHIHVFLGGENVTVIDLDRSRPADPAKDIAEFIHRMRTKRFKATGGASRAEAATTAFIEEYAAELPENLGNLPFYWGYHNLVSLWRFMKASTPADPKWVPMIEYYRSEFERAATFGGAA